MLKVIVFRVYDLFLTSISIFYIFWKLITTRVCWVELHDPLKKEIKFKETIHQCNMGIIINLLILFSILIIVSVYPMYIQSKVLHCEHVFVLFFYYLYYKIKVLLMLICMQFVVQCFNCLLIQSRIFFSTNKIRCVHDFGRKSLETCLFPFHQKKEYLYIN